jgi:5-hydroxyisourate hydrolase-like protein (transthyretin family)
MLRYSMRVILIILLITVAPPPLSHATFRELEPSSTQSDSPCTSPPPEIFTGTITGTVFDDSSSAPLAGIAVFASTEAGLSSTRTDDQGTYALTGLAAGDYLISFEADETNYLPEYYDNQIDISKANRVKLADGASISGVDARLRPGAIISGTVSGANGINLADVGVIAFRHDGTARLPVASTASNEQGRYTLAKLPDGTYDIEYVVPYDANEVTRAYLGGRQRGVNVGGGQLVERNINLRQGAQISGTIIGGGAGVNDVQVRAYDASSNEFLDIVAVTDNEGRYLTRALASGSYKLEFVQLSESSGREYYNNVQTLDEATVIELVAPSLTSNINADIAIGGKIRGTVTGVGGILLEGVVIAAKQQDSDITWSATTDSKGSYTLLGLPTGTYEVSFIPSYATVPSVQDYVDDFYGDSLAGSAARVVEVTAPNITANIDAQLMQGARISGCVTRSDSGESVKDFFDVEIYTTAGQKVRSFLNDANGSYTTGALPSGSYKVCFRPQIGDLIAECYNNAPDVNSADELTLVPPIAIENIHAELEVGSQLAGRVYDVRGTPLSDVSVAVLAETSVTQTEEVLASATTDSNGAYTTSPGLAAGNYTLRFTPPSSSNLASRSVNATIATTGIDVAVPDVRLANEQLLYLPIVRR